MFSAKSRETPNKVGGARLLKAVAEPTGPRSTNPLWQQLATRVQPKLSVSAPDDPYEREADVIADRVMRMPEAASAYPESGAIQRKKADRDGDSSKPIQNQGVLGANAALNAAKEGGEPLPSVLRAYFEPRFGRDFSNVRVHTGPEAAESARAISAHAYTAGSDIVFGHGEYAPDSTPGRALLAHELAHVAHSSRNSTVYRKGKDDAPLDIQVPEPGATYAPQFKYPWQNPELRKSIYPYRDEELAFFLRTYMEIDLEDPATATTSVTAEELTQERAKLKKELTDVDAKLKEATTIKDTEVIKNLCAQIKVENVLSKAKNAQDRAEIIDLCARSHRLQRDLNYLPEAPKKGGISKSTERKWTAYRYSKMDDQGNELDHDALLARILDRFDADPGFNRYPKWLRYMVLHFSGMRYQSAHGSYAPAIDLVKKLKREQLLSEFGTAPESDIEARSTAEISELETELTAPAKPSAKRVSTIKTRLTALHAVEKEREAAFSKKGEESKRAAFEELTKLEEERDSLKADLDSQKITDPAATQAREKRLEEIKPLIEARESEIGAAPLKAVRKRIEAAEDKRRNAVIEHEIERAEQAFSKLDDMQALAVIKAMRAGNAFPEWVWRENRLALLRLAR